MEVAPFFVDFHHFLSIFTIFYRFSRFTHFCRDLHFVAIYALFPQIYFGQISLLCNITRFLRVWPLVLIKLLIKFFHIYKKESNNLIDLTQECQTNVPKKWVQSILFWMLNKKCRYLEFFSGRFWNIRDCAGFKHLTNFTSAIYLAHGSNGHPTRIGHFQLPHVANFEGYVRVNKENLQRNFR